MTPAELIKKSERAADSAQLLLDSGDADGACNRAYYAMFDAARMALTTENATRRPDNIRSHSGLITAFSLTFVKTQRFPLELGRAFNKVHEIRLIADYKGDPIDEQQATWAVEQAKQFIDTVRRIFPTQQ